jgi:hypothetical protein
MAEIMGTDGKGRQKGSGAGGVSRASGVRKATGRRSSKPASRRGGERKTRKRKVKGYGVDLLRAAAERRMAESSVELAETLVAKALEGKMDSVKMLMKLGEEEKVRREEAGGDEGPSFADMLFGSTTRIGQVWDGTRWKRIRKGKTVEGEPEPDPMTLEMGIRQAMIDSGKCKEEDFKEEKEEIPDCEAPFPSPGLFGDGRGDGGEEGVGTRD